MKKQIVDQTITPVQQDTSRNEIEIPKIQTPPGNLDTLVRLLLNMNKAPISTDFKSMLPFSMSIDITPNKHTAEAAIKAKPIDNLDATNTLNTGDSVMQTLASDINRQLRQIYLPMFLI